MAQKIVVFGAGMIADVVHSFLTADDQLSIAAFTCDRDFVTGPSRHGLPFVPFDEVERTFPPSEYAMLVAVGYHELNALRAERCQQAREKGYRLVSWVSPCAHVPQSVQIGENCFVMEGASVQPYARLGDNVFVWTGVVVGHHSSIEDNCWLASNCTIAGRTTVSSSCFLGVNSVIGQGITVGSRSIIGAAAVVTHTTEPGGVYIVPDTERFRLDSQRFMRFARML